MMSVLILLTWISLEILENNLKRHPNHKRKDKKIMEKFNTNSLLTRVEAADFLGVSSTTLALWKSTKRYGLPVVMVGRLPKYRYSDLLEFIEMRTVNKPNVVNELKYDVKGDKHNG
jgi:hypothetical protein